MFSTVTFVLPTYNNICTIYDKRETYLYNIGYPDAITFLNGVTGYRNIFHTCNDSRCGARAPPVRPSVRPRHVHDADATRRTRRPGPAATTTRFVLCQPVLDFAFSGFNNMVLKRNNTCITRPFEESMPMPFHLSTSRHQAPTPIRLIIEC